MSKAIDAMRNHFNQKPMPKAKCLLNERNRINAMLDDVEAENTELRELVLDIYWDYVTDDAIGDGSKLPHYHERMRKLGIEVS